MNSILEHEKLLALSELMFTDYRSISVGNLLNLLVECILEIGLDGLQTTATSRVRNDRDVLET